MKADSLGRKQYELTVGGNGDDRCRSIIPTRDHGYIVGGTSNSDISGNKTEASYGSYDYWIVKLDSSGHIQWDKTIGSAGDEEFGSLTLDTTLDGGYVVGANTTGEVAEGRGKSDYRLLKLNHERQVQWDKTIGGSDEDYCSMVLEYKKNEYILGGSSSSGISGDRIVPKKMMSIIQIFGLLV